MCKTNFSAVTGCSSNFAASKVRVKGTEVALILRVHQWSHWT